MALLEDALAELGEHKDGRLLIGGEEAYLLWCATLDSFVSGIWVATVLCAQATCERALAGLVSLRELPGYNAIAPEGWEKWGLGTLVNHIRKQRWVPDDVLDDVEVLCEVRKPYGHWRRPLESGTFGRHVADAWRSGSDDDEINLRERILSRQAHHAATTALRLYFGDHPWCGRHQPSP